MKKGFYLTLVTLMAACFVTPCFALEEVHHFMTSDGKDLALTRQRPAILNPRKEPLLLLHGIASNRYTWDLTAGHSISEYLVAQGYDVWMLELRGSGRSEKPPVLNPWGYNWSTEEYITLDYPPAVSKVLEITGAEKLFLFGHSMGGMIIYAYLETHPDAPVRGVVTMGSPGKFGGSSFVVQFLSVFSGVIDIVPVIYANAITDALIPLSGLGWTSLAETLWNFDNMTTSLVGDLADDAVDNISTKVVKDFLIWENIHDFTNRDQSYSYRQNLNLITQPILVIGGASDGLGVPENVRFAYDNIGSQDKEYVMLSQAEGFSWDYGHLDMVCGVEAPNEVYPLLGEWVKKRDSDNDVFSWFDYPQPDAKLGAGPHYVRGDARDTEGNGLTKVEVSTDAGRTFQLALGTSPWQFTWTPTASGRYTLVSRATDFAGNVQVSNIRPAVDVDLVAPGVQILRPTEQARLNQSPVLIEGQAQDNGDINGVWVSTDGGRTLQAATGDLRWSYQWTPPGDGTYTLSAVAKDDRENVGSSLNEPVVHFDATAPSVAIHQPASNLKMPLGPLTISGSASDVHPITQVLISFDGGVSFQPAFGTEQWSITWTAPLEGRYDIVVQAVDSFGNNGSSSFAVTLDSQPPTLAITSPPSGAIVQANHPLTISGTAQDLTGIAKVEITTDGGNSYLLASGTTAWSYTWTPTISGQATIIVRATDGVGYTTETPLSMEVQGGIAPPRLLAGGYLSTKLEANMPGRLTLVAYVTGDGHVDVEVTSEGVGAGIFLRDEGLDGDSTAGDGLYTLTLDIPTNPEAAQFLLGLEVRQGAASATWPSLKIRP